MEEHKKSLLLTGVLLENIPVASSWHCLVIGCDISPPPRPGQFVQVKCARDADPLLRRPFSVHYYDSDRRELRLLIRVKGKATALLAGLSPGAPLDLLGPLGNFFPDDHPGPVMLVAGGVGLAPLFYYAALRSKAGKVAELLVGGRTGRDLPADSYFTTAGIAPQPATEDGSRGYHGTVVGLLRERLRRLGQPVPVYACGPPAMLAEVAHLCLEHGLGCRVSLEAHMACGVGACLGCVIPVKDREGTAYRRVCADGPVFNGAEVDFKLLKA